MEVKSKFSLGNVYFLSLFMGSVLVGGIYFLSHSEIILHTKFGNEMSAAYLGLLLCVLSGFYFYYALKNFKRIIITNDEICLITILKTERLSKYEIKSIDLFSRKSLGLLSSSRNVNCIKIITNNSDYFIPDIFYRNSAEIKSSIEINFQALATQPKNIARDIQTLSATNFINKEFEKFSGNFWTSLHGIMIVIISIIFSFLFFKSSSALLIWVLLFYLFLVFFFAFGAQCNYFLLSTTQLVVKNQVWWWRNIVYDLSDIDDVVIEDAPKQSNALRINTKDFKSKKYPAGSLRNKAWKDLLDKLNSLGINGKSEVSI